MELSALLYLSGLFSLTLGSIHIFLPILLDFKTAIPIESVALKPFRLLFVHYATLRSDILGIAWVMNHAASYVLISIGVLDLLWPIWLHTAIGPLLAIWMAGWWLIRALSQFYLGRRRGDWLILAWFLALAILHLAVAL